MNTISFSTVLGGLNLYLEYDIQLNLVDGQFQLDNIAMDGFFVFLIYSFTLIGLLGLSWAFYRLVQQSRKWLKFPTEWGNSLSLLLTLILNYFAVTALYKLVFKCFAGLHCSASQAGEMILLSTFAVILIGYEVLLLLLSVFGKKLY